MSHVDLYHHVETPSYPAFLTPFTVFHLLSGVLAFVVLRWLLPQFPVVYNFVVWFVAHGLYELKDVADPQTTNSPANSFGDTIASMLGFFLTWLVFGERPVSLPVVFGVVGVVAVASFVIPEKPS
jgi:hypothetical protein